MSAAELKQKPGADVSTDALAPGTILFNGQYRIDRHLGSGGFGITYLARDSLERVVVIKECYPEAICNRVRKSVRVRSSGQLEEFKTMVGMFVREARSIAKLNHPNIVGVHQIFEDNHTAYMALDFIDGNDLLALLEDPDNEPTPAQIKTLLLKVLDAVHTVHSQDMLHRDISPDNILIDSAGEPIMIDFGAAREEASKKSRALSAIQVVKDGYSPQEFYIAGGLQGPYSDLYSIGATFAHLITGKAPPNSQTRLAEIAANNPDPFEPLKGRVDGYEPEFLGAIDKALAVFPNDRIQSAEEWTLLIDTDKRTRVALQAAEQDTEIAATVSNLISITGKVGEKTIPPTSMPPSAGVPKKSIPKQPAARSKAPRRKVPTKVVVKASGSGTTINAVAQPGTPRIVTSVNRREQIAQPANSSPRPQAASLPNSRPNAPQSRRPQHPSQTADEQARDDAISSTHSEAMARTRVVRPGSDEFLDIQNRASVRPRRVSAPNTRTQNPAPERAVTGALRTRKLGRQGGLFSFKWMALLTIAGLIGIGLIQANRVGFEQLPTVVIDTVLGLIFADLGGTDGDNLVTALQAETSFSKSDQLGVINDDIS